MKTYDMLKEEFIEGCMMRKDVDYGDPASVKRYNKGMDLCRQAVMNIVLHHQESLMDFYTFLDDNDFETRTMCAFCILDYTALTAGMETRALEVIDEYFEAEEGGFLMQEIWLTEYKMRKEGK